VDLTIEPARLEDASRWGLVSFDRLTPALGVTLGHRHRYVRAGSARFLWPAAEVLQPYSLFHDLKAKAI